MGNRRSFIRRSLAGFAGLSVLPLSACLSNEPKAEPGTPASLSKIKGPVILSTWFHGLVANEKAIEALENGGSIVDAVEKGVAEVESDPSGTSVGLGGAPDREGKVTLDACIMDPSGNAGSVCFLENIMHPVSVARKVMDDTPHVLLAGEGAYQFAIESGFPHENLLTEESEKNWKEWLQKSEYKPIINVENHDTIGLVGMDAKGNLSGACTTSGLAYKMRGRVGDSPIIGAGLFVDNEVGAATATGLGEAVLKTCGSFLVVELMRQGKSPQEACEEAVKRIAAKQKEEDFQVGYIALSKSGEVGAFAIHPGFNYALMFDGENKMFDSPSLRS